MLCMLWLGGLYRPALARAVALTPRRLGRAPCPVPAGSGRRSSSTRRTRPRATCRSQTRCAAPGVWVGGRFPAGWWADGWWPGASQPQLALWCVAKDTLAACPELLLRPSQLPAAVPRPLPSAQPPSAHGTPRPLPHAGCLRPSWSTPRLRSSSARPRARPSPTGSSEGVWLRRGSRREWRPAGSMDGRSRRRHAR